MIDGLLSGLATASTPFNLLMVSLGCFAGTFIGMLPGLGPVSAVALMIPVSPFRIDIPNLLDRPCPTQNPWTTPLAHCLIGQPVARIPIQSVNRQARYLVGRSST